MTGETLRYLVHSNLYYVLPHEPLGIEICTLDLRDLFEFTLISRTTLIDL